MRKEKKACCPPSEWPRPVTFSQLHWLPTGPSKEVKRLGRRLRGGRRGRKRLIVELAGDLHRLRSRVFWTRAGGPGATYRGAGNTGATVMRAWDPGKALSSRCDL